jgi:hypothetical protein
MSPSSRNLDRYTWTSWPYIRVLLQSYLIRIYVKKNFREFVLNLYSVCTKLQLRLNSEICMRRRELTPRQREFYAAVCELPERERTLRNLGARVGLASTWAVRRHLDILERHGLIERQPKKHYGIKLLPFSESLQAWPPETETKRPARSGPIRRFCLSRLRLTGSLTPERESGQNALRSAWTSITRTDERQIKVIAPLIYA